MQRNFFHQNNSVENIKLTVEEKNIQTDSQLIYGLKSSSVLTFVTRKCRIAAQYPKIRKINHHYFETTHVDVSYLSNVPFTSNITKGKTDPRH